MNIKILPTIFIALLVISSFASAEIYRYQDEYGKWQYTDKKPPDQAKSEVVKLRGMEESQESEEATGENIAEYLAKKLNPGSDIEKATLAVVKIKTSYGSGSGFFVTENGYLITNKHVVRPTSSPQIENELKQAESNFKRSEAYLKDRGQDLERYKKQIEDYKIRLDSAPSESKPEMTEEYNFHDNRYAESKKDYRQAKKQFDEAKDALALQKSAMSQSNVEFSFKIIFKDGTEKQAKLVELSKERDLALLKIEGGYVTPYLEAGDRGGIAQGGEIFVIGSPFGMPDMVTRGIVTRQEQDRIITDAKSNPGNSGGPMVTPLGKVIGVNSQALFVNGAEVFGFAIPIELVKKDFGIIDKKKSELDHKTP